MILLHDNATLHKSWHVTSVIDEYKWETLKHPAYSPDLSPCDFDLFPELKKPLRAIRFEDVGGLKVAVAREVRRIFSGCLATGLTEPMERSHWTRGKLLRRILATVGLYNLLFSYTKTTDRTFWLTLVPIFNGKTISIPFKLSLFELPYLSSVTIIEISLNWWIYMPYEASHSKRDSGDYFFMYSLS